MYLIKKTVHFDAAHFLREYHGKCENFHGHRWKVVLGVRVEELDEEDMGIDFVWLKKLLQSKVVDRFDHKLLNDCPPFDQKNPTSENLAFEIHQSLAEDLNAILRIKDYFVEVWESPTSQVRFSP